MKCATIDRNLNGCRGNASHGKFCKIHSYMIEYTEEMVSAAKPCGTCRKTHYMGEYTTCDACRKRGEYNRKDKKKEVVLCAKEGCKFKQSENKYCGKHQLQFFLDSTIELGLNSCVNSIRGCRSQMENTYEFSRCQACLSNDREKDHVKRGAVNKDTNEMTVTTIMKSTNEMTYANEIMEKQCSTCCKMYPMNMFEGQNGITKTCQDCRDANKKADEKRNNAHVKELARKNSQKPERKDVKKAWNDANYEKVTMYCIQHRKKQIENGPEEYLKHNAEIMKSWRDKNPEKVEEINLKKVNNIDAYYTVYKNSAETKQLCFEINKETYLNIVKQPCNYCGILQDKGFNGIDRIDSAIGYTLDNCVSCCAMCNYMKKCLSVDIFLKIVEHVITYNKMGEGKLYPEAFNDVKSVSYTRYKYSAKERNISFDISRECFYEKVKYSCYLCGKENTETHKNGLDRVENNIGYIDTNVKSCCGSCNLFKSDIELSAFLKKCIDIYLHNQGKIYEEINQTNSIVKGNKLTKDNIKQKMIERKLKKLEYLKTKYTPEYIKEHLFELTETRNKKIKEM